MGGNATLLSTEVTVVPASTPTPESTAPTEIAWPPKGSVSFVPVMKPVTVKSRGSCASLKLGEMRPAGPAPAAAALAEMKPTPRPVALPSTSTLEPS